MPLSIGQSSGDSADTTGRVHPLHAGFRSTGLTYAPDAFTQANPRTVALYPSTTLAGTPSGVLSGSVAFTRPDAGNGFIGGPKAGTGVDARIRPVGLFIIDAQGRPMESISGRGSNVASYYCGAGSSYAVSLYETQNLSTGAALTWSAGDTVYASRNGLLTNLSADAYETVAGVTATVMGLVKIAPDASNTALVIDLRV